jgi:predicted ATPase/DNA-binding CsgD family transcriptional regulator
MRVHAPHLPAPRTRLLGRDAETAHLTEVLAGTDGGIVCVVGAGGSGKTRLAVDVARRSAPSFRDGASFVELTDLLDPALLAGEIVRALGLDVAPGVPPADVLVAGLQSLRMLIVLDGFEHLVPAAPVLGEVARRCPGVALLVTSRRRLAISEERTVSLGPLSEAAAVALFCDRATAANPRFAPDPAALRCAAELCRLVDGLPLAIELVASRVRFLPPDALLARLHRGGSALTILEGGPADAPARQRSLRDTIRWSYDLLGSPAATLLPRLAVFHSGWTAAAVAEVCCDDELTSDVAAAAFEELLGLHLVEAVDAGAGGRRGRLPETVRRFAIDILRRSERHEAILERHADYFVALALRAGRGLVGADERSSAALIDRELPNIRAALRRRSTTPDDATGLAAAAALGPYWLDWGPLREGREWLDAFLERPSGSPRLRAVATGESARLAVEQGDVAGARERLLGVRQVLRTAGSDEEQRRAADHLATALRLVGEFERADRCLAEAIAGCRGPGAAWSLAELLLSRAVVARDRGDTSSARAILASTIDVSRRARHERVHARAIMNLALTDPSMDDAKAELDHAFELCHDAGDLRGAAMCAAVAAVVALDDRDPSGGAKWFLACLDTGVTVGYWPAVAWAVMGMAGIAARGDRPADAARLHGAVCPRLDVIRRQTPPDRMASYDRLVGALADRLGDDFEAERDRGEALGWAAAVDLTRQLAVDLIGAAGRAHSNGAHRRRGPRANPELTDRELDVLRELVVGRTNQHIADRLGLSAKTVMHHTGSVYRKLGVRGRAEAVARALRDQLVAS